MGIEVVRFMYEHIAKLLVNKWASCSFKDLVRKIVLHGILRRRIMSDDDDIVKKITVFQIHSKPFYQRAKSLWNQTDTIISLPAVSYLFDT